MKENEYGILCPSCHGLMDDTNRIGSTVVNAHRRMPGGEAYIYIYRCPQCGNKITWTYKATKPIVSIEEWPEDEGEEE